MEEDETNIKQDLLNKNDKAKIKANCCVIICEILVGILCFCK